MFKKIIILFFTLAWLQPSEAANQAKVSPLSIGDSIHLPSQVLGEERQVSIYLPSDYNAEKTYQTIYVLDAEYHFIQVAGSVAALVSARKIPDSIVVGIHTTVRVRDYLPPIQGEPQSRMQKWTAEKFPRFGGTQAFQEFLVKELFPYIEKNYAVNGHRSLIGHSNAGVFALHTLTTQPRMFANYLAISPAAWWDGAEIDQNLAKLSDSNKQVNANLYLSTANEGGGFYANASRFASNLALGAPQGLTWQFKHYPEHGHSDGIYDVINKALPVLFKEFYLDDMQSLAKIGQKAAFVDYYQGLNQKYQTDIKIPQHVLSEFADGLIANGHQEQGLAVLELFVGMHPYSSFAHSSLGQGYLKTEQFALAKQSFETSLQIVKNADKPNPSVVDFLQHMLAQVESSSKQ